MFLTFVSATGNSPLYVDATANDLTYQPSSGNLTAAHFVGDGSYLTGVTGSYSNSNVASYLPTYAGNITAGNINLSYTTTSTANLGNAVRANYFVGDGSGLTGITATSSGSVANGNSNIAIPTAGGNVNISVNGVANVLAVSNIGINLPFTTTSNANLGNAVIANYIIGNGFYLTNVDTSPANISNTTSNVQVYTAGPVTTSVGGTANVLIVSSTGITVAGSAIVGNLTVTGTTTTVNSTTTRIVDPMIELGGGANGATLTVDDNKDRGLLLHYFTGATATDAFMGWDDSNGEFGFGSNVTSSSEVITWNAYANVRANYFVGNGYYLAGVDAAGRITNGTSNVNIPSANGNITLSVGGTANTVVFANTGNYITTAGNLSASYLFGNGSTLSGISAQSLANGNSNISIAGSGGSVNISANGVANVFSVSGTGVAVSGTANLGPASSVIITGGTSGYVLQTDGSGNLNWTSASGALSGGSIIPQTQTLTISSNAVTINLTTYSVFELTLSSSITSITLTNVASAGNMVNFMLLITADGTPRSITWPTNFKWPNGTAPSITSTLNKKDAYVFFTTDGGTTWEAMIAGQNL